MATDNIMQQLKQQTQWALRPQTKPDVAAYLRQQFGFAHLPADFTNFIQTWDGLRTNHLTVFSVHDSDVDLVLTFDELATSAATRKYLSAIPHYDGTKYGFFAADYRDGRYAFRIDQPDPHVYYFNIHQPQFNLMLDSFTALLQAELGEN